MVSLSSMESIDRRFSSDCRAGRKVIKDNKALCVLAAVFVNKSTSTEDKMGLNQQHSGR